MTKYFKDGNFAVQQTEYFHPRLSEPKIVEARFTMDDIVKRLAELHKEERAAEYEMWNNDNDQDDSAFYTLDAVSEEIEDMENLKTVFETGKEITKR